MRSNGDDASLAWGASGHCGGAVGAVAVGDVNGERRLPVETGRSQATLEARGILRAE